MTSTLAFARIGLRVASCSALVASYLIVACSSSQDDPGTGSAAGTGGGTSAAAGSAGSPVQPTAGMPAAAGMAGSNAGGVGTAGMSGSASGGMSAGTSGGGVAGVSGSGGSGGSSTGGGGGSSGGSGGGATGGGGNTGNGGSSGGAAQPSAGCGKASPATGSSGSPLNISGHDYYVKLPAGYDASKPYKVMIVFPPTGNPITWSEQSAGYEMAAPDAIRVYTHMANESAGWQPNETSFFKPLWDDITGRYCIDKGRVFAGGESSGGEFAGFVGCENGDLLRGVVPNAPKMTSWKIDPASHTCKGNPTAIVSWSEMDMVLQQPAGPAFRDFYRTLNMCQTTSTPVQGYTDALSNCKMFDGCKAGDNVYYCMHMDPNYSNTYHGWPGFMAKMSWGVFSKL